MAKVKFDEIARECRSTFKGDKTGVAIVGLEHIVPNEMLVKDYEVYTENTFTKSFKKGQILFGRRRAYQQKAGVATFDGICSGDITVIEAIESKVDKDLLPFIIQNERFFEHAVQGSAGSLSPRVKWEHLASYEFDLPPLSDQKILADKLWAAYRLKESYKKLLAATDEMVKSQFIEMLSNSGYEEKSLGKLCDKITDGSHNPPKGNDGSEYLMISSKNVFIDGLDLADVRYLSKDEFDLENKRTEVKKNDILLTIVGTIGRTYLVKGNEGNIVMQRSVAVLKPSDKVNPLFMMYSLHIDENLEKEGLGNAQKGVYLKQLSQFKIKVPSLDIQNNFCSIYQQADKSKFELRKSIEAIDAVIKSLINN